MPVTRGSECCRHSEAEHCIGSTSSIEASNEVRADPDSLYAYANNPANTVVPVDPHKMFVIGFQEDGTGEYYKFTLCWSTTHLLSFAPRTVDMVLQIPYFHLIVYL